MNNLYISVCILVLFFVSLTGCVTPDTAPAPDILSHTGTPPPSGPSPRINPSYDNASDAQVNTSTIPLLFTDADWNLATGCGWTEENISESAVLLMNSCHAKNLISDGWTVDGMRYDIDILGSRCRRSTHPDAPDNCDWCSDAGPTLVLQYKGLMTTELMAHLNDKTVTAFRTTLPPDTASVSGMDSERIVFRNGTVLYTFQRFC
jgi:hypothetical protein